MSRYKRVYYTDAVYHVFIRGNNKHKVLKHPSDKTDLLVSLQKFQNRKLFKIFAFVFMDNHAHFILGVNDLHNISNVMQALLLSYSLKYRRKYGYEGYVWQGRFQSKPIYSDEYFNTCLEYIHFNPVKAKIVNNPCDYLYSSARFYNGMTARGVYEYISITEYGDSSVGTR